MPARGWIGVDLDGTLAHYEGWKGATHIGAPVPAMVERVKRWLEDDQYSVKIFTARVGPHDGEMVKTSKEVQSIHTAIVAWCLEHLGTELEVTCIKDYAMIELWDDRAVGVEANTGRPLNPSTRGL
jgi:aromatic ring-cleaving dioxygenase